MGNANSGERRKSREGEMSSDGHGTRRKTRPSPTYDDNMIEPVNITAHSGSYKGHAVVTGTASAGGPSRGAVPPHRPRATTESAGSAGTAAMVMHHQHGAGDQAARHRKISAEYGRNGITSGSLSSGSSGCSSSEAPTVAAEKSGAPLEKNNQQKRPTMFKYPGTAKEVYICGTFNNWQRLKMSRSTKDFVATVDLPEGAHEYKFVVDGQWTNDPNSKDTVEKEGSVNNVIRVRKEDFNAFDALDMDSEDVLKAAANSNGKAGEASNSKAEMARRLLQPGGDEFGQEMPTNSFQEFRSGPPILPPHLLQVILNKDTPLSCEPTLLPEPNHVMINHLYALSIKDGVMVLSSTQRYRKKYVTTLLYKPMGSRKED